MVGRPDLMRIKMKIVGAVLGLCLVIAGPASAAVNPTQAAYSKPGGVVQQEVSTGGPKSTPSANVSTSAPRTAVKAQTQSSGNLPFTGLQLGLIVGAGLVLLGTGFGLKRAARPASR